MPGEEEIEQTVVGDPLINATIGNYQVTRKIGEGGMGSVYLAEHPLIGKKVALKVLHSEFSSNQDVVTRFFNEAKAVNDIQHPNIVDIIDYGVIPSTGNGDMVYFIMEHLDGYPLENVIEEQAPLSPERSLHICAQVADALAASHSSNIVHRDLKPDNIILVPHRSTNDFVKLLDFGIAKLTGDQPGSSRTRTGIVMGTPAYMSPEQCEGKGNIDARTDVYALGVVLYQMITGRVPFEGQGYGEVLVQHLTQPPAPPSTIRGVIPPHVEAVCMKALEKNPDARYQSMEDFIAALTDPVGFVEANGGLQGFYNANLGSPVLPPTTGRPPTHGGPLYTPSPGQLAPAQVGPTTQYPSGVFQEPQKSKTPLFVGAGVLVAAGIAAAVLFAGGGDEAVAEQEEPEEVAAAPVEPPPVAEPVKPEVTPPPVETPPEKAAPASIKVRATIVSRPKGAEVWIGEEYQGKTPFKEYYESDELPLTLVLKRKGYEDREILWEFNEDQRKQRYSFKEKLERMSRKRSRSERKPTVSTNKGGLVTPSIAEEKPKKKPKTELGDNNMAPSF